MTEKYTAVCFVTVRCMAELEPTDDGVRIRLTADPKRVSDTTIFVGKEQPVPSDQVSDAIRQILPIAVIQKEAELSSLPANVSEAAPTDTVAVKKEDLN